MASVVLSQEGGDADLLGSGLVIPCEESGMEKLEKDLKHQLADMVTL